MRKQLAEAFNPADVTDDSDIRQLLASITQLESDLAMLVQGLLRALARRATRLFGLRHLFRALANDRTTRSNTSIANRKAKALKHISRTRQSHQSQTSVGPQSK